MAASLSLPDARIDACLWRGSDWAHQPQPALSTGHAALDAALPGGGWPVGAMSELLLAPHAHGEWTLALPALARLLRAEESGRAVLVAPPLEPFTPALHAAGVPARRLCWISPPAQGAEAAWACEQALRCRDVRAVLAWLPQAPPLALRRLQLAAAQHRQLLWVLRPEQARRQASPAPLRLWVRPGDEELFVHVLKRRGPPLAQPVALPARSPQLAAALQAQAWHRERMRAEARAAVQAPQEAADALARLAPAAH